MQEMQVQSPGWEDPLEKEAATHSSILDCEILWTEEPGRLQSMRSERVRHEWVTKQQKKLPQRETGNYAINIYAWCYKGSHLSWKDLA